MREGRTNFLDAGHDTSPAETLSSGSETPTLTSDSETTTPAGPTSETTVDVEPAIEQRRRALRQIVDLRPGEQLERLYVFDPVERSDVAFSLALVTKRLAGDRLELLAIGGRAAAPSPPDRDFIRRARFPEPVLPRILEEFIDRGGVGDAGWIELSLDSEADPLGALLKALEPRPDPA